MKLSLGLRLTCNNCNNVTARIAEPAMSACRSFITKAYVKNTAGARRLFFSKDLPESKVER